MVFKRLMNAIQTKLKFPYVDFNKNTQNLKDFPIKMCINLPIELQNPEIRTMKTLDFHTFIDQETSLHTFHKAFLETILSKRLTKRLLEEREGFLQAYIALLETFEDGIDPEVFCEYNLARALKVQKAALHAKKLNLKMIGNINSSEVIILNKYSVTGNLTPLRNLTLPAYDYEMYQSFKLGSFTSYKITYNNPLEDVTLEHFKSSNLKQINTYATPHDFLDLKRSLASFLEDLNLYIRIIDVGIYTSYKPNIYDSEGNLIYGNPDADAKEFHLLRFEKLNPSTYDRELEELFEMHFKEERNEYMLTDVDGYLKGNSLVPGSNLEV